MLRQSPCSVASTRHQLPTLAVRGRETTPLMTAEQSPRRNKMSQLISLRETRSSAAICPCRQVNVREKFPMLASFVEEISDWDFPDSDTARALAIKVLPSTTPCLIVQYRESMSSSRKFLDTNIQHGRYHSIITRLDTGVITIRPPGPLGAIIVRFKPEASALLFAEPLHCFSDIKIDLGDIFDAHEVKLLEEVVSEVPSSFERVAAVAHFLCAHMCPREPDPMVCRAAACLRSNPSTRVHRLAADLDVSERQLLRRFRRVFGVSPKQFARCERIEKVLVERSHGSAWADIAYGCGFADQAHMINDFNAVLGVPPERALLPASAERGLAAGGANGAPIARDYFFW
jgi:AraC-like DNA-binding protein